MMQRTSTNRSRFGRVPRTLLALALATSAYAQTTDEKSSANEESEEDILVLTPFQVDASKDQGYFAENTLAGSRLKTNLADLAASITVVTKQQMEDTASLDINDVFRFEANTEGSSDYTPLVTDRGTAKDTIAGYTLGNDGGTTTNSQSNRVRGLGAPDVALNNFPTSGRVPFDAYNVQSIEISRGPNSMLFGMGSPAGIVNQSTAQAVLNVESNSVSLRTDHMGSIRASAVFNRPIIEDKLAVTAAFLYNDQRFERKPAKEVTERQYGAFTFRPFSKTVIRGFAENYNNFANRPNFITPRDYVTPWLESGRPMYDTNTRLITKLDTGETTGPYVLSATSPYYNGQYFGNNQLVRTDSVDYVQGIRFENNGRPIQYIDGNNQVLFTQRSPVFYRPAHTNPQTAVLNFQNVGLTNSSNAAIDPGLWAIYDRQYTASTPLPVPSGYSSYQYSGVTDKSIYDWTKYSTNQANFSTTDAGTYNVELEQQLLDNLYFNAAWMREDVDAISNNTISQLAGATLEVDTNTSLPDGTPNPYAGLIHIEDSTPDTFYLPQVTDNYRAMLAYDLDFTEKDSFARFFGKHRISALWSKTETNRQVERWRNGFTSGDPLANYLYLRNLTLPRQPLWSGTALRRWYYMAQPGDAQATVTQSTGFYGNKGWDTPYNTSIKVFDWSSKTYRDVNIVEQAMFSEAGSYQAEREIESQNLGVQSYLWNNRLITTLGWRSDDVRNRQTTTGAIADKDGNVIQAALPADNFYLGSPFSGVINRDLVMNRWGQWDELSGNTSTVSGALRPLQGFGIGGDGQLGQFLDGLTLYYNQSDNFNPPTSAQTDFFRQPLPKPTGTGKTIGIGFNMFDNKLVARLSWFENTNENERTSAANTLLTRLIYGDTTLMLPWATAVVRIRNGADPINDRQWNTEERNPVTSDAVQNQIWDLIGLERDYYNGLNRGGTQNSKAEGLELSLTYNPSRNWTMKVTGGKQETSYTDVAPEYDEWFAVRNPVWQAATATDIADFTDANGTQYSLKNFWSSYGYSSAARITNTDGNTSAGSYFDNVVTSQIALAKALEGVAAPSQRKYRMSFLTNYTFQEGRFRGWSVGGSQRWASKAAIGYFGYAAVPGSSTINRADVTRPVWDEGQFTTDFWVSYSRRILNDKVRMKIQFNIDNVFEDGGLEPFAVNFDGSPWAYRIKDPRAFKLTTKFDF